MSARRVGTVGSMGLPTGFRAETTTAEPRYCTSVSEAQANALIDLITQCSTLIANPEPDDPAITRLFPAIYPEDPEVSEQLRQLTHDALQGDKEATAGRMLAVIPAAGGDIRLTTSDAHMWLRGLTDIRLILGIRLGVADDTDLVAELDEAIADDPNGPTVHAITLYHYATFLQESLVCAVADGLPCDD